MLRTSLLRVAVWAAAGSASLASAQQAAVAVSNPQPAAVAPAAGSVAAVPVVAAPAGSLVAAPQSVALPAVTVPSTVVYPVPGVNSLAGAIRPRPTVAVTSTVPQGSVTQQTRIYTPTFYYYYYTPPSQAPAQQQAVPAYPVNWQPVTVAPVVPVAVPPFYAGFHGQHAWYGGHFGPMFNARGEAGHVRYPYYSYRRPWYYAGQPSFNVTIPGPVW